MQAGHLPLSGGESVAIGALVAVVVFLPVLSVPAQHFSAMTHEGFRAILGIVLGLTVTGIILDRASGHRSSIAGEGLRAGFVVLIGFLGPSLLGLGAAFLISLGQPIAVLWLLVVLLIMMMFLLSWSFGWISVPFAIFLLYVILRLAHTNVEVVTAYVVAWLLLVSGMRAAFAADSFHRSHASPIGIGTVPGAIGSLIWLTGTLAALIIGGKLLVLG